MTANIDSIKKKIMALLALANSTTHEGEAAVFLAKATELMTTYQIELFDLGTEDPIGVTQGVLGQSGVPGAKSDLQIALCCYYGGYPVVRHIAGGKWYVDLAGPESSRVTTEIMTEFVWTQVRAKAKVYAVEMQQNIQTATRNVAKALVLRIRRELAARKAANPTPAPGTSFSLTVVDATLAFVARHYEGDLTDMKQGPRKILKSAMEHAKDISLNHQVATEKRLRLE